jgi:predicted transcriptional regulator
MTKKENDSICEYIHLRLIESFNGESSVSYGDLSEELIYIRIPKMIVPRLIKELEDKGILNRISNLKFEIVKPIKKI